MPPQIALIERARVARAKSEQARDPIARAWFEMVAKRLDAAAGLVIQAEHLELRAGQRERSPGGGSDSDPVP